MNEQAVFDTLKYRIEVDGFGTRRYYSSDNQLHRVGDAAVEHANGSKFWYQNHKRHRIDGPAIIFEDGHKLWYINGKKLTEAEFNQKVKDV